MRLTTDRPDEATPEERARHAAASMYAAELAGLDRRSIGGHFGVPGKHAGLAIDAIPPVARAIIERSADDPRGEVERWRRRKAESDAMISRILAAVAPTWGPIVARQRPRPQSLANDRAREMYRHKLTGVPLDAIAASFSTTRAWVVVAISRLSGRERRAIERESAS